MARLTAEQAAAMRRAGLVLAIIGLLDIGYCFVAVARGESYSSSLNIFALVAGILVYRGSGRAARFVIMGLSFLLGALLLLPFVMPFLMPPRLLWLQLKWFPFAALGAIAAVTGVTALLYWIRRELGSLPVYGAGTNAPSLQRSAATWIGAGIPVVTACLLSAFMHGDSGRRAVEEARRKVGPGYSFHVRQLVTAGTHGSGIVTAYSTTEFKDVPVEWNDH